MNDKAVYRIAPATPGLLNITNPADMLQWNFMVGLDFCVNNRFTLISRSVKARCCSSNTVINHSLGKGGVKKTRLFIHILWIRGGGRSANVDKRGGWPGIVIKKKRSTSPTTADFSAICHLRELYFHILRISALQSFALVIWNMGGNVSWKLYIMFSWRIIFTKYSCWCLSCCSRAAPWREINCS